MAAVESREFAAAVFTLESLYVCAGRYPAPAWFESFSCPQNGSWGVVSVVQENLVFMLDRQAGDESMLIVIRLGDSGFFGLVPPAARAAALQRIHRVALKTASKTLTFPPAWSPFRADNKLTVFAYPHGQDSAGVGYGNDRLIAAVMTRPGKEIRDLLVTELTTEASPVELRAYRASTVEYFDAIAHFDAAVVEGSALWRAPSPTELASTIDLAATSYGSIVRGRTYSVWRDNLSSEQYDFVTRPPVQSLKLRGPAGTGKTLALELKALHLLYEGAKSGSSPGIAFLTHSWAVAEQVDAALGLMDERGLAGGILVVPLLALAQDRLPARASGYRLLGEDSYSGKLQQLRIVSALVADFAKTQWLSFRRSCSSEFRARMEAPARSVEHDTFVWDLTLEFACVIAANGILPGITALERYLQIERMSWMMPLATELEKRSVMELYSLYVKRLEAEKHFTSDQVIGDYLNFLAMFHWRALRREEGYDFIFVDELHLFNEQERLVFHQLTRDPDAFPILFMALDPRQSPAESYVEFRIQTSRAIESRRINRTLGEPESIDLLKVYRYTPEILEFLRHIDGHLPALELGEDWGVSVGASVSLAAPGPVPQLFRHPDSVREREVVLREALAARSEGRRVAVLCVDQRSFGSYKAEAAVDRDSRFQIIASRDDVDRMRYAGRRSIVVSTPEFVAGLQFDSVILAGLEARVSQYAPNQGYELRRFVSSVYAGASRAIRHLQIHVTEAGSGVPEVIESAVGRGCVRLVQEGVG